MTINIRNIPWSIFTQYCVTMTEFLVAYLAQHQKLALWIVDEKHPMPSAPGFFRRRCKLIVDIFRYYLRQYRIDTYSLQYDDGFHLNGPTVSLSPLSGGGIVVPVVIHVFFLLLLRPSSYNFLVIVVVVMQYISML